MNDLTNGGAAAPADDSALFASVIGAELPSDPPTTEPGPEPSAAAPATPATPATPEPSIPPGRLREETEARRTAERERDELRGRLAALERIQQPRQPEAQRADPLDRVLTEPSNFVREEARQVMEPYQRATLYNSRLIAESVRGGKAAVDAATAEYDRLETEGQLSQAEIQEVRTSLNPFVAAVDLIERRKIASEVGTDLGAYRNKILEEALKDPEFHKRALNAARQAAQQNGQVVHRPAVSPSPSLSRIGVAALPDNQADVSDHDLFASTTRRGRHASG